MGRLQHLERLALGRSPFQHADPAAGVRPDDQQIVLSGGHQYDSKARPINPAADQRNQSMRNAQNAVLSLVGVVESTDALSRDWEQTVRQVQHLRSKLLDAEQDRGEDVDLLAPLLHRIFTWWPETLLFKVQAGVFARSISMATILRSELQAARHSGVRGVLSMLLPGLPIWLLFRTSKILLCAGLGEGIGQLQQTLNKRLTRKRMKQVNCLIKISCELVPIAIDALFLPLQYLAISQSLGLLPPWRPSSIWGLLLPWNTTQLHSTIWKPTHGTSAYAILTSSGAMMILKNFLEREQGDGLPIGNQFTSFEWPAINAQQEAIDRLKHKLRGDLYGRLLFQCYLTRAKVMRWLGWNLEQVDEYPDQERKYQNNASRPTQSLSPQEHEQIVHNGEPSATTSRFRSTSLAHQPAQFISDRIDGLFSKLMMLPIDGLVVRTIAHSNLLSGWPKTRQAIEATPHVYPPFGNGLLGLRNAGWHGAGVYAERLGLSLSMKCMGELTVLFILYGICRYQGVANFDWGDMIKRRQQKALQAGNGSTDEQREDDAVALNERSEMLGS